MEWIKVTFETRINTDTGNVEKYFDGPLPDNDQEILISTAWGTVHKDTYFDDYGCYLDSGLVLGTEVLAWQPLPIPYKQD